MCNLGSIVGVLNKRWYVHTCDIQGGKALCVSESRLKLVHTCRTTIGGAQSSRSSLLVVAHRPISNTPKDLTTTTQHTAHALSLTPLSTPRAVSYCIVSHPLTALFSERIVYQEHPYTAWSAPREEGQPQASASWKATAEAPSKHSSPDRVAHRHIHCNSHRRTLGKAARAVCRGRLHLDDTDAVAAAPLVWSLRQGREPRVRKLALRNTTHHPVLRLTAYRRCI